MKTLKTFAAASLLALSWNTFAGVTWSHEVAATDTYIRGGVSAADQSSDNTQYVGCYINSYDGGAAVVCIGRTSSGTVKSCIDTDPNEATLNAVSTISDSVYIYAEVDSGTCTRLSVHSSSAFIE